MKRYRGLFRKIAAGLSWAIAALFVYELIIIALYATLLFYWDSVPSKQATVTLVIIWYLSHAIVVPSLLIVFLVGAFRDTLPRFYLQEESIEKKPALLLSVKTLASGARLWAFVGLSPAFFVIIVSALLLEERMKIVLPGAILYLSLSLLFMLLKKMKVAAQREQ